VTCQPIWLTLAKTGVSAASFFVYQNVDREHEIVVTARDYWHHVLSGFDQWHIQQCRQPATASDLGAGPVSRPWFGLFSIQTEHFQMDVPDPALLGRARQLQKEHAGKTFASGKLWR
jgi:hypothetical protein